MLTSRQSYGGHSGGETPGLIPNPEAKPSSADGTAPERVWESRTPPDNFRSRAAPLGGPRVVYRVERIRRTPVGKDEAVNATPQDGNGQDGPGRPRRDDDRPARGRDDRPRDDRARGGRSGDDRARGERSRDDRPGFD